MKPSESSLPMRTVPVLLALLCVTLASCSFDKTEGGQAGSSAAKPADSAGSSSVNMREVVGDFCPPAHATKGNC